MYTTQLLDNRDRAHLDQAAALLIRGEIVAFGFNGIFVLIGDADQDIAARRIASAKRQPMDKPLVMICSPDYLAEFVDLGAPAFRYHPLASVQQLQREAFCLGVLLPATKTGLPSYMTHNRTVLNVWMEYPPHHPSRYLQDQIRARGARTFIGSSANLHGQQTYVDALHIMQVFGGTIPAVIAYDQQAVPRPRLQSSTLIDLTGEFPRLLRSGNVPLAELRGLLQRAGLRPLQAESRASQSQARATALEQL